MPTVATDPSPKILPLTFVPSAAEHVGSGEDAVSRGFEVSRLGRVVIDIAGVCQAKCPYCAQNSGKARRSEKPAAYMPVKLFRDIVSRLSKSEAVVSGKIDRVFLYNWGEPFLAPRFDEYLEVLKEHRLFAMVSSNFQRAPVIRSENLPVIAEVIFSLSGLTEETYGRIHGGAHISIKEVLANFEAFRSELKRHAPKTTVFMSWHRYTFNEHEFWKAYKYSRKQGVGFLPQFAYMADLVELIQAASDKLPAARKADAKRDIFYDHMVKTIDSYREHASEYECFAWNDVVIDEKGRLLLCGGVDSTHAIGTPFDMTFEEMREKKIKSPFCKVCKEKGVAEWAYMHAANQMPWPSGGGLGFLMLQLTYKRVKLHNDFRRALDKFVFGEAIIDIFRKLNLERRPRYS